MRSRITPLRLRCALSGSTLAFAVVGAPAAIHATTLQELLSQIDGNPMLLYAGLYVNYSEIKSFDAQSTTIMIDGSIIIANEAEVIITEEASTPGTGPVVEIGEPPKVEGLKIATSVIGGSNQGFIDVDHIYTQYPPIGQEDWGILPGRGVMAINATSTQADVTGSVTMLYADPNPPAAEIKTSAIGASNVGRISIVLMNGAARPDNVP